MENREFKAKLEHLTMTATDGKLEWIGEEKDWNAVEQHVINSYNND